MMRLIELAKEVSDAIGDDKLFLQKQKKFTAFYRKANASEQGEYHQEWCDWIRSRPLRTGVDHDTQSHLAPGA